VSLKPSGKVQFEQHVSNNKVLREHTSCQSCHNLEGHKTSGEQPPLTESVLPSTMKLERNDRDLYVTGSTRVYD